jgi:PhnB protein
MQCNPYLLFNGNCEPAFKFYEKVLGGKIIAMMKFSETPAADMHGPDFRDKIVHARLTIGGSVLMASDAPPAHYEPMTGMQVTLNVDTAEEAERIFKAFAEGGNVKMPIQETFWAIRYGMLVDRFGTPWMINCEKKQ